ncbi:hypothetical protein [Shewanella inventionis]|uniref:hypothetical protein n=1 Tax=Shewanella inventionis TaxID=1738770 RepID=UPI001E63C896|nr:hypothetical protein [Shewanella inventionis]
MSWNAGAARLLVPESQKHSIQEMMSAEYVIITRGKYQGRDALEILFEDNTDSPYSITVSAEQTDRLLPDDEAGVSCVLSVWMKSGHALTLPAKYRVKDTLPCLAPWS